MLGMLIVPSNDYPLRDIYEMLPWCSSGMSDVMQKSAVNNTDMCIRYSGKQSKCRNV